MNLSTLTLKTWLIILKIIQLVKYMLKKDLNTLNEINNAEIIKYKRCTSKQKKLLSILFKDLLDTFLTNKSESQKDKNENENENDKTLM